MFEHQMSPMTQMNIFNENPEIMNLPVNNRYEKIPSFTSSLFIYFPKTSQYLALFFYPNIQGCKHRAKSFVSKRSREVYGQSMVSTLTLSRHYVHSTLMQLVSLMSWSMSDASPLSLAGSCCRTTPSPAQLYRLWAHFPSATPARGRSLVQQHIVICFLAAACAE